MELVNFVLTTTYFTSKDIIYQQKQGAAMGSPLSPVAVDLFMEWLEEEAIATAPESCRPKLWKRYVDDVLEIIKVGEADNLTNHLNQIDPTGSMKFTNETESNGSIPFLDTNIIRKQDGKLKLCIYHKPTHLESVPSVLVPPPSPSEIRCCQDIVRQKRYHRYRGGKIDRKKILTSIKLSICVVTLSGPSTK